MQDRRSEDLARKVLAQRADLPRLPSSGIVGFCLGWEFVAVNQ